MLRRPPISFRWALPAILLAHAIVWLWHLQSVSLVIPADNIEELVWVRSAEWGYYKHPPLTTWLLWPLVQLFGLHGWVTTIFGAALTLTSIGVMVALARKAGGPRFGLIALLAVLCVTFYNGRLYYYNHNISLMIWVALSALTFHRILLEAKLRWWIVLGVIAGLGMLSKYQYALLALPMAMLYVSQGLWRIPAHRKGLLLAVLLSAVLFAPHLYWLLHQKTGPIQYAMATSFGEQMGVMQRIVYTLQWTADWLFNRSLPALIIIGVCAWGLRPLNTGVQQQVRVAAVSHSARLIVLMWGFVPLATMAALGMLDGVNLQLHWGTAFALWTVPAIMLLFRFDTGADLDARLWRWLALPFVLMQAVLLVLSYETSAYGHFAERSRTWWQFPAQRVAAALAPAARAELGGSIQLICGQTGIAGAISLELPERPKVVINGDAAISPWVSPQEMQTSRAVWIWNERDAPPGSHPLPNGLRWSARPPA